MPSTLAWILGNQPNVSQLMLYKNWHVVTLMDHQELIAHQNITHWICMDDMKWFSSN
jgi:hypothetical protein